MSMWANLGYLSMTLLWATCSHSIEPSMQQAQGGRRAMPRGQPSCGRIGKPEKGRELPAFCARQFGSHDRF